MFQTGQKVLWTIDFQRVNSNNRKPEIFFATKNPLKLIAPPQVLPVHDKAHEFLDRIQAMCSKITKDCQREALTEDEYLRKSDLVSKELGDLDDLIKKLNEILKWFRPPETEEKTEAE